jgi:gliding motility-associated-like protein
MKWIVNSHHAQNNMSKHFFYSEPVLNYGMYLDSRPMKDLNKILERAARVNLYYDIDEDFTNDEFKAVRVKQIKDIDLALVDRWGHLVYHTTDPYFKWDGISQSSKQACSEGTYFYVCTVSEPRLRGTVRRTIKGHVQLVR